MIFHIIASIVWRILTFGAYVVGYEEFALYGAFQILYHDERTQ